jgi:hypothetical protein
VKERVQPLAQVGTKGGHTYGTDSCYNQDLKERVQLPSQVGTRGRPHNQDLKKRVQLPAQVGTRGWPHIWYSCYNQDEGKYSYLHRWAKESGHTFMVQLLSSGTEGKSTATCTGGHKRVASHGGVVINRI